VSKQVGLSISLSTSPSSSTNNMLIVQSICTCVRSIAVMLDGWHHASWGWVLSSLPCAMTIVELGIIRVMVSVVVNSSVAVGITLSIVAVSAEGAGGDDGVLGGGVIMLGVGILSLALHCHIQSIAAVIAASSDR